MSDLNYTPQILAEYHRASHNKKLLEEDRRLNAALAMPHPQRECAIVEWAQGEITNASDYGLKLVQPIRDPFTEWSL